MDGHQITGALKELDGLMGMARAGLKQYQNSPPGMKQRSERDKREIYNRIMGMSSEEKNVKLQDIASLVGPENLAKFLLEQSRRK